MRNFPIKNFIIFLLPIVVIVIIIKNNFISMPEIRLTGRQKWSLEDVLRTDKKTPNILMGSSHAAKLSGLIPCTFVPTFGAYSSIMDAYLILSYFLQEGGSVKHLILEIDPIYFAKYRATTNNMKDIFVFMGMHKDVNFIYKLGLNLPERALITAPYLDAKNWSQVSRYYFNNSFKSFKDQMGQLLNKGLKPKISEKLRIEREKIAATKKLPWLEKPQKDRNNYAKHRARVLYKNVKKIDPTIQFAVKELLKLAQKNNIKTIGLLLPHTQEYLTARKALNLASYNKLMEQLKFDETWDYTNLYENNPEYFFNQDHLNNEGAKSFSALLQKKICP